MRGLSRRQALLQAVGILFYLAGGTLFLFVIIGATDGAEGFSPGALTDESLAMIGVSIVLLVLGGYLNWTARPEPPAGSTGAIPSRYDASQVREGSDSQGPDASFPGPSRSHETAETQTDGATDGPADDGLPQFEYTDDVVCKHCGTRNESEYQFCSDCGQKIR